MFNKNNSFESDNDSQYSCDGLIDLPICKKDSIKRSKYLESSLNVTVIAINMYQKTAQTDDIDHKKFNLFNIYDDSKMHTEELERHKQKIVQFVIEVEKSDGKTSKILRIAK